jgi:hypothetical protein
MVSELDQDRYFRWFDSGDVYTLGLAEKILEVMICTPWVNHWLPTRMHKFPKFAHVFAQMEALPNVKVRFSSDSIQGEYIEGLHGSVIGPDAATFQAREGVQLCEAYKHGGNCNGCRACWSKDVPLIAYPAHGLKMSRVIKLKQI